MQKGILRSAEGGRLLFRCPGCNDVHGVQTGIGPGPRWAFNGDFDRPTFSPSVLVTWSEPSHVEEEFDDPSKDIPKTCHSFVRDGQIQFLGDCTHPLAGQTVPLPPFSFRKD